MSERINKHVLQQLKTILTPGWDINLGDLVRETEAAQAEANASNAKVARLQEELDKAINQCSVTAQECAKHQETIRDLRDKLAGALARFDELAQSVRDSAVSL